MPSKLKQLYPTRTDLERAYRKLETDHQQTKNEMVLLEQRLKNASGSRTTSAISKLKELDPNLIKS